jgi:hypothetical protein
MVFAFTSIGSLALPAGVTAVAGDAFYHSKFSSITVDDSSQAFFADATTLWSFDRETLVYAFAPTAEVVVPAHVKVLGAYCFYRRQVRSLVFEQGSQLQRIGDHAFDSCSIASISVPASCESLGNSAFYSSACGEVTFESPSRLTALGSGIFSYSQIAVIQIPSGVAVIPGSCFRCCQKVKSITFEQPSQLTTIQSSAFRAAQIQSIELPESVSTINDDAWTDAVIDSFSIDSRNPHFVTHDSLLVSRAGATLLRILGTLSEVTIPNHVEIIAGSAFASCATLTSVLFERESQTKSIRASAFAKSSLVKIALPSSVEEICSSCFAECLSLQEVTFESGSRLRIVGDKVFAGSSLATICLPVSLTTLGGSCFANSRIVSVTFEAEGQVQLKALPARLFASSALARFDIPASVTSIDPTAFATATCTSISVDERNQHFVVNGSILLSKDGKQLVRCFAANGTILIPESVEIICNDSFAGLHGFDTVVFESQLKVREIGSRAFQSSSIVRISIPASVEVIRECAFSQTGSFVAIAFEPGSHLKRIEPSAFAASKLKEIRIPSEVTFIGAKCFEGVNSLEVVTFEPNCQLSELSLELIAGTSVREICIPAHVALLQRTSKPLPLLATVTFEPGSELGRMDGAFLGSAICRIDIPQSVEVIGANCFQSCKSLETVEFDDDSKLRHIDPTAFLSSSVHVIMVPKRISSLFSCATPAGCTLEIRKLAQQRAFALEEWTIDLSEYERVMFLNQGTVRLLQHRTTSAYIVAKEFPFPSDAESSILNDELFKRELESLITLRHPSIVTMQGWAQSPDAEHADLMFQYLPPPSLKHVIAKPEDYAWWTSTAKAKAIVGLVQAMTFVHSRNLMHRELKTRVVFFDEEHEVKVGGFGRSKFDDLESLQQTVFDKSTSLYQAPEMWTDDYDGSVDVYAFAMILFRVATGHSPFPEVRRKTAFVRMNRVMKGDRADIDQKVIPFTRGLIESCWDHDPAKRPSFVQIMEGLDRANFQIFPDVDSAAVRRYIELIRVKSQLL